MSAPSGLSERVRRALAAGRSKDEVVQELVAEGLSRPTAERFVDRALNEPATAAAPRRASDAAEDSGGRGALVSGAFWFSLGLTITGATYLLASSGEEYVVAWGAVLAGLLALGRGVHRFWGTSQPFPWIGVVTAAAAPPALALALSTAISGPRHFQREARRADEAKRLEQARAEQDDARAAVEREAADLERAQQHDARVARARDLLQNARSPMSRCEAALDLGHARAREAIPDLTAAVERITEDESVRNCAAGALVELGETERALAFYVECARAGTSDCRRIAILGFKDIGPPAAEVALPYLREALASPHWDVRLSAVETLANLGPLAEPLLREATLDTDERVRQRATKALGQ